MELPHVEPARTASEDILTSFQVESQQKVAQLREMEAQLLAQFSAASRNAACQGNAAVAAPLLQPTHGLQPEPESPFTSEYGLATETARALGSDLAGAQQRAALAVSAATTPTVVPEGVPPTIEEVNSQLDSLTDFLRAKMVRLEAEQPGKLDVYNRAPQLMSDLAQLYCDLYLLADVIDDGCDQSHNHEGQQPADSAAGERALHPEPAASTALHDLQLNKHQFAEAFSYAASAMSARRSPGPVDRSPAGGAGHGASTTWVVEVDLSPQPERELQPDPRNVECLAWTPEVGWDENAMCAWVREWDEQAAMWRYTNLDTQQETWSYPSGVEQFEPVEAADSPFGVENSSLVDSEDRPSSDYGVLPAPATSPQSPGDASPQQDNGELEAAIEALEQQLAAITATKAGQGSLEPGGHDDAGTGDLDLQATVVSVLTDADMLAANAGQRPSEQVFQQVEKEFRARLSATGRRQLEEAITARIKKQVEISIAELTSFDESMLPIPEPERELLPEFKTETDSQERAAPSDAALDPTPPPSIGGMIGQADMSKLLSSDDEAEPGEPAPQERAAPSDAALDPTPPPSIGGIIGQADMSKLLSSDDEAEPEEPAPQERAG
eukprot:COSAG02_NODE_1972_length_10217_cov_140.461653_3_plen_611_part_00